MKTFSIIFLLLILCPILSIAGNISIVSISGGGHYCKGEQIVLLCIASGDNLTYQWYKDESAINGENNQSLIIDSADYFNSGIYKCAIYNSEQILETNSELVYIDNETGFIEHPANNYTTIGKNVNFRVQANTNGNTDSYLWYRDNEPLNDFSGKYSGTKTSLLSINNVTALDTNYTYWCKANGTCNTAESDKAKFVLVDLSISYLSPNDTVCWDSELSLKVVAKANANVKFGYQWYKDDEPIIGAISDVYFKRNTRLIDDGTYYCKITELKTNYSIISNNIKVIIQQKPEQIMDNFYPEVNQYEDRSFQYYVGFFSYNNIRRIEWFCNDTLMPEFNNVTSLRIYKGDKSLADVTPEKDYYIDYQAKFYCILYNDCGYYKTTVSTLTFLPVNKIDYLSNEQYDKSDYLLSEPAPNPVKDLSVINFSIPVSGIVKIIIYNELGIQVSELVNEYFQHGSFMLSISPNQLRLPKGFYFYTMSINQIKRTKKLIIE